MKLTYWSHSCFLLETGTHRLVMDPFLTGNPKAPLAANEVKCDFVLVSHGHNDHLGDAVAIARRNHATIIASASDWLDADSWPAAEATWLDPSLRVVTTTLIGLVMERVMNHARSTPTITTTNTTRGTNLIIFISFLPFDIDIRLMFMLTPSLFRVTGKSNLQCIAEL